MEKNLGEARLRQFPGQINEHGVVSFQAASQVRLWTDIIQNISSSSLNLKIGIYRSFGGRGAEADHRVLCRRLVLMSSLKAKQRLQHILHKFKLLFKPFP